MLGSVSSRPQVSKSWSRPESRRRGGRNATGTTPARLAPVVEQPMKGAETNRTSPESVGGEDLEILVGERAMFESVIAAGYPSAICAMQRAGVAHEIN